MRFPPSFLDELRARLPVSEVVGRHVKLKRAGREWKGLSPFNKERTPSFTVNDQKGFFHDFSSGKHGDIFDFLVETEGLTFPEAVERLASMAGLPLPVTSQAAEAEEQRRRSLYDVLELATKFFEATLASKLGAKARGYLADRGILQSTQVEFRLGYAPYDRAALREHLGGQGVSVEDMIATGLLVAGDDIPVPYDRFRDRVIIPIHDQQGRVIGFGGRTLSDDVQPKYLNSPETSLFHKGTTVFNFHRARKAAHDEGSVIVVEGYMDAIAIFQAGIKGVVASMGTAFTEEQINALWRLSPEPVVCFDADRAGVAAAHRAIERILPELKVGRTFRFALLHGEKDPDDLIREKGIDAFRGVLAGSLPIWDVLWEREIAIANIKTPDGQAALEHKLKSIVRTINDTLVRTAYERIARTQLANLFWQAGRSKRDPFEGPSERGFAKTELKIPREGRRHGLQKVLLGLLVHFPDFLDEKADVITQVTFSEQLEEFRVALYDLLITHGEMSVSVVYKQLNPSFYKVLQEIHGEHSKARSLGHRLFERFPILKVDPPREFISRCIDHFCSILRVDEMADEIEGIKAAISIPGNNIDELASGLPDLMRDFHAQRQLLANLDMALAEEAKEMRRVWGAPELGSALGTLAA
jgi:DNA primase